MPDVEGTDVQTLCWMINDTGPLLLLLDLFSIPIPSWRGNEQHCRLSCRGVLCWDVQVFCLCWKLNALGQSNKYIYMHVFSVPNHFPGQWVWKDIVLHKRLWCRAGLCCDDQVSQPLCLWRVSSPVPCVVMMNDPGSVPIHSDFVFLSQWVLCKLVVHCGLWCRGWADQVSWTSALMIGVQLCALCSYDEWPWAAAYWWCVASLVIETAICASVILQIQKIGGCRSRERWGIQQNRDFEPVGNKNK